MSAVGIIPARYASTRFPGKPLAEIAGIPMIQRVWERARRAEGLRTVIERSGEDPTRGGWQRLKLDLVGNDRPGILREISHVLAEEGVNVEELNTEVISAPMPGHILNVLVAAGDAVEVGDTLLVMEAMKMENEIKAHVAGTIAEIKVSKGQDVGVGEVLAIIGG